MSLNLPNVFLASIFFFLLLVLLPSFKICSAGLNELILIISFNLVLNASTVHTLGKNVLTFWKIIWKSTVVMNSIVKSFFLLHCKELMYSSSGEAFKFCNDFTFSLVWSIRIAFFQAYSSLNSIWEEKLFCFQDFCFCDWDIGWMAGTKNKLRQGYLEEINIFIPFTVYKLGRV